MSDNHSEDEKDKGKQPEGGAPPADPSVGYKKPPIAHQFKKGVSGNPPGRPKKQERSLTVRQQRRDILDLAETPTKIKTDKGVRTMPLAKALKWQLVRKALGGHGPSLWRAVVMFSEATREHEEVHKEKFEGLEQAEKTVVFDPSAGKSDWARIYLNTMRKLTRRT